MEVKVAKIIMVEDNPAHVKLAQITLSKEGFVNDILFFSSGDEARAYLQDNLHEPPDIIFIDRVLQGSDLQGDDIASYMMLEPAFAQTEICIISATYVDREKENEYAAGNVKFFLKKPLITEQLESVIKNSNRLKKLIIVANTEAA